MTMMLITFGAFLTLIAAMAVGVIFSNKPIKGSCGGLSTLGLKDGCVICGGKDKGEGQLATLSDDLFYDAAAESGK